MTGDDGKDWGFAEICAVLSERFGTRWRGAANPEQAARRRYAVLLAVVVLGARLLIIDAIDTKRHRYVNLAVIAIMIGGVAFDWIRARRRRTKP